MKPLNCCKECSGLNENGEFRNKLKCTFCEDYGKELSLILYNEAKVDKGCDTCKYCKHMYHYPAYITAEECVCEAGLECDTVLFRVKDFESWVGKLDNEE